MQTTNKTNTTSTKHSIMWMSHKRRTLLNNTWLSLPFIPSNNCHNCGKSYPWKHRFKFLHSNIRFPNIRSKIAKAGTIITIAASTVYILQVFFDFI